MKKLILIPCLSLLYFNSLAQNLELFEIQKRCSLEADLYLQKRKDILSPSADAIHTITNHYNKKNGWCLLRVQYIINRLDFSKGISLINVLENKSVSWFVSLTDTNTKKYTTYACKLSNEKKCFSEEEFESDAQKLMSD
jgi:hypothetical protein